MMLASILLAASLSSSIGDFFTLPSWMPNNVSAADTPGSDAWYVDEVVTNVPSGRKVPRAARLTPEVASGVNSTFEGYFERMYYASQGQSNGWDVATWGPRLDLKKFKFDPLDGQDCGWDYSTNRTITSRRLVEYDKIDSLADQLLDVYHANGMLLGPVRPGWIESATAVDSSGGRCWWSTTDTKVLDGTGLVPAMNWVSDPFDDDIDWSKCSQVFLCLDDSDESVWTFYRKTYDLYYPTCQLMSALHFGQRASYGEWEIGESRPETIDGVSMGHLIQTNFPYADGWAITNSTRRLFSDRLCCMNQMLGLMDRTYHLPAVVYPSVGTNTVFTHEQYVLGTAPVSLSYNASTGAFTVDSVGEISWGAATNKIETSGTSAATDGASVHYRTTGTGTTAGVTTTQDPRVDMSFGRPSAAWISSMMSNEGIGASDDMYVFLTPSASPIGFEVRADANYVEVFSGFWPLSPPAFTNAQLAVTLDYKRSYNLLYTVGAARLSGATQPGWQSQGRAGNCRCGTVAGVHCREGSWALSDLPWSVLESSVGYKSNDGGSYSTRSQLENYWSDKFSEATAYALSRFPADPTVPSQYVPIGSDFGTVRDSIRITGATAAVSSSYSLCVVWGSWDGSAFSVRTVYTYDTEGSANPAFVPMLGLSISATETHNSPTQTERAAYAADVKAGILTSVDWNWNALRRGSD